MDGLESPADSNDGLTLLRVKTSQKVFSHEISSRLWFVPALEFQYKSLSCGGSTLSFLDAATAGK